MEIQKDPALSAIAMGDANDIYQKAFAQFNSKPMLQSGDEAYDVNEEERQYEQCFVKPLPKPFKLTDDEHKHFTCSFACQQHISSITFNLCKDFYNVLYLTLRKRLGGCTCEYTHLEKEAIKSVDIDVYVHDLMYSYSYFSKKFLQTIATHCNMVLENDNGCVHYTFWRRVAQFVIRMRHHRSFLMDIKL